MKFVCALPAAKVLFFNLPAKNKTKVLIFSQRLLRMNKKQNFMPVSYTHLTLPTNSLV